MIAQIAHCVSGQPFRRELLQPSHEVENAELIFDDAIIPEGNRFYSSVGSALQPGINRTVVCLMMKMKPFLLVFTLTNIDGHR